MKSLSLVQLLLRIANSRFCLSCHKLGMPGLEIHQNTIKENTGGSDRMAPQEGVDTSAHAHVCSEAAYYRLVSP